MPKIIQIIDASHLFFRYAYGGATALSATIKVDGDLQTVDTTLPTYVIKQIHRWSQGGVIPTAVCFDGYGCTRSRKAYFINGANSESGSTEVGYKGSRTSQDSKFFDGVTMTQKLLQKGGVCCLKGDGYEADDLIFATVQRAKVDYPDAEIHVITGDVDLVPLVDDKVSVFLNSRKVTWAREKGFEKRHYIQLVPDNYSEYCKGLTQFKNLNIEYNTVLLAKCLRGDKSDDIKGFPKFTPTKFNNLINSLIEDGVDIGNLFRYDAPIEQLSYKGTGEPIPEELIESTPKEQKLLRFLEPPKLTEMCNVLSKYLDDEIIEHIKFIYNGINLNCAFTGLPDGFNRKPAKLAIPIKGYQHGVLADAVSPLRINLPVM